MGDHVLDTEQVKTDAGIYTISYIHDPDCGQPEDEPFVMYIDGREHWAMDSKISIEAGAVPRLVTAAIQASYDGGWGTDLRSAKAIVRYLQLLGNRAVTIIDGHGYSEVEPDTNRDVRIRGVAYVSDPQVVDPERFMRAHLKAWEAWAKSDTFGYVVSGPDGQEVDSCWGYYGYYDELDLPYVRSEAATSIEHDVMRRLEQSNLVGAGFVGLI